MTRTDDGGLLSWTCRHIEGVVVGNGAETGGVTVIMMVDSKKIGGTDTGE